jgi:hypothetical protein
VTVLDIGGASSSPLDVTAAAVGTSELASTGTTAATSQTTEVAIGDIGWNGKVTPSGQTAGYTTTTVQQSTITNSASASRLPGSSSARGARKATSPG